MVKKIGKVCLAILGVAAISFGATTLFDFEDVAVGAIPAGWKVESMNKSAPIATFACAVNAAVPGAQAGNHVMKVTGYSGAVYQDCHICWTDAVSFLNGTIEANTMADSDTGYVGLAWRIKDKNNYYAFRYSPEEGLAVFKIVSGSRSNLGSSTSKKFAANTWYKLKVVQNGNSITISVDGTQALTVTNSDISAAGGVGLFMRAYFSKSEWDNLSITTPGTAVRPYSGQAARGSMTLGKTTVTSVVNLQGRVMPIMNDNSSGMTGMKASATYYGVDRSSNRAIPVLKVKK